MPRETRLAKQRHFRQRGFRRVVAPLLAAAPPCDEPGACAAGLW